MNASSPAPSRVKEHARLAAVCAACGPLILPATCSVGLLIPVAKWALGNRRGAWVALSCAIVLLAGLTMLPTLYLGHRWLERGLANMAIGTHTSVLSAQIHYYYQDHGDLPETLEELRRARPGAPQAYTYMSEHGRAEPRYLPVDNWDEKTPVVVAVLGPTKGQLEDQRAYVVLGHWAGAHYASHDDLQWILKMDNAVRLSLGDEHVWRDLDCNVWPGGKEQSR